MKKKLLTILLTIFVLCAGVFTLSACGGVKFKVNFIVDGEVYSTINTNGEEIIKIPDNPTKEGYTFDGWFWDKDVWEKPFTANSLLDAPLSSDMSVYAKFSLIHNCDFKEKVASDIYKATGATCENKATYYFSCSCGEKGTETFESGVAQGHSFTNYISDNNATCEADGTKTAKCENCEETDTITDVGSKLGHSFTNYISDNNATCEADGTKTAKCENCEETDTITDVGSKLGHSFTNYISDNNATCEVDGTKTAVCNRNGCNETDTITDVGSKLGHSFTNYISDNNATYDADGTKTAKCENCEETDTITDVGSKLQSGFAFNSNYQVNGRNVFAKVASETESVYFPDVITLVGNASYKVYRDINCDYELKAKEFTLVNIGENKCYILATVNGEDIFYHITIYLRTKFTVDFITNNNTTIESQVIEEDSLAQKPNDLVKAGYTFNGYDFDFNTPITKNETVTALWTANDNTPYTVEYYLENLENEEYTLTQTNNLTGVTDTTAYAEIKTFEHFTAEKQTVSGNINGNGTTVLKVYYQRNEYTVNNANTSLGSITGAGKYKYGKQITLQSSPILAYNVNWYSGEELLSDSLCYTVTIDKNITAKFALKPEMANFNFTSTATTCVIRGVKNKTITEIVVPNYVTSIKSGAFSGCSKLQSITIPFVGAKAGVTSSDTYQYPFGYIFGTSSYTGSTATTQHYYGSSTSSTTSATYYIPTSLKEVTVTGGNILSYAFENCDNLTSVVIGNSVTSIGKEAFYSCNSLTSIEIPNSVTSIGDYAFYYCTSLTSIEIPDSVTSIGSEAFRGCYSLASIEIPNSVTSIGSEAFYNCYSLTIYCEATSKPSGWDGDWNYSSCPVVWNSNNNDVATDGYIYTVIDGIRYSLKDGVATVVRQSSNITSANIPSIVTYKGVTYSVTRIGGSAFENCSSLTSIEIPNSVTSIGSNAFSNCTSLTSIEIPNSVTSIGSNAFSNCISLTSIEIPDSVTSIGEQAFYGCKSLTSVVIGDSVTSIGEQAFYGCKSLTSIEIPDSVTSIGEQAFYGCKSLTSVVIGDSVTSIGSSAFYNCDSLTSVYYNGTIDEWAQLKFNNSYSNPLYYAKNLYINNQLVTEANITSATKINDYAFYNCDSLTSIEIPNSVTSIGSYAFRSCDSLTIIVIPDSVTSIGFSAFEYCTSLTSITIPNSITSIGYRAFYDCDSLTSVTIGDSVTSIGDYAFYSCDSLTSVVIGDSVTSIGEQAFAYCDSLTSVYYNGTIDEWVQLKFNNSYSNPLYYAKNLYINNQLVTEANITSATKINDYAFYNCDSLTSVEIPNSVTSIGFYAFSSCSSLTSIEIPNSVTSIGSYAFYNCDSLTSITLPFVGASLNGTSNMHFGYIFGAYTYSSNSNYVPTSLKEVIITGGSSIGDDAFYGCNSLTSIEIPNSVKSIGSYAFYDCNSLTSIEIPDSVKSIGSYAFQYCRSLTSIEIPNSVTSIGDCAFRDCNLLTIYCEATYKPSGWYSYWNYSNCPVVWNCNNNEVAEDGYIYTVVDGIRYGLKDGVANIVRQLRNITISSIPIKVTYKGTNYTITSIGDYAFYDCDSLTSIIIPDSVTSMGSYAFYGCNSLTSVVIGDSVTSIADYAFRNCHSLTSIEIPNSVTSIGDCAFYSCDSLTSIEIPNSVTSIGKSAFLDCQSLTSIDIPDSVTSIGSYAFNGCTSLTSIEIPNSVTSIGDSAFHGCSKLTSLIFRDTSTWYRTTSNTDWNNKTNGTSTSVTSSSSNATYFKSTYYNYYWYKK